MDEPQNDEQTEQTGEATDTERTEADVATGDDLVVDGTPEPEQEGEAGDVLVKEDGDNDLAGETVVDGTPDVPPAFLGEGAPDLAGQAIDGDQPEKGDDSPIPGAPQGIPVGLDPLIPPSGDLPDDPPYDAAAIDDDLGKGEFAPNDEMVAAVEELGGTSTEVEPAEEELVSDDPADVEREPEVHDTPANTAGAVPAIGTPVPAPSLDGEAPVDTSGAVPSGAILDGTPAEETPTTQQELGESEPEVGP